ncbi:MAG: tyrosine--tRNA ligase [Candidatus Handelsmanbacteria bacterium RIFCSPLOWO2_12_FULL_64_10]|uniref:Tyrosine--tRNA ligase n=1 Tax=Handelsmanbacteria sp. (strain RIFCSPLOWO2_12_FULL_64_10) TaxID=1817868 RepID=A0A1F6CLK9_HANXR|nr:MAG: tyrosine--tRNA ligase [Candidatus Handelsmanbacteria bacterium RIFCSPLOWO2_12_FULL_64_10]
MKSIDEQVVHLMRGADYGDPQIARHMAGELRERLSEGRPLRVYCGYDPTAPDIHLGHTVSMRRLRRFQDLGHEVVFLIGNFTGLVGDASDKDSARPQKTPEKVAENARTYAEQAFKILDRERTAVRYNADWLGRLSLGKVVQLASHFTVQQFLIRENFRKRWDAGDPVWMHEFFYALMQAYDAVVLKADVQLGGTEQLFNLMAGRKLQEVFGQRPQVCITLPILVGTDGRARMSKSTGNTIGIDEPPEEQYGKVMSLPDGAMSNYFNLVTRWSPEEIAGLERSLSDGGLHPMEAKRRLAWEVVDIFHGGKAADRAAAHFERVHQERDLPEEMPTFALSAPVNLLDLLVKAGLAASRGEGRRLVQQGGVRLDGQRVEDSDSVVKTDRASVLQVGKRRFLRLECPQGED